MIRCACLASAEDAPADAEVLFRFDDDTWAPVETGAGTLILRRGGESRAAGLLEAGVPQVLLGEAAMADAELPGRLATRFGAARVGLFVPARRMVVSWSFDTVSNADFRVVTPSLCEPGWEILRADGSATGIRVDWWLGEMNERAPGTVLVQVDMRDDTDLNLCAGLVEDLGERLWIAPAGRSALPALADWIVYGKATRIALPPALFGRRTALLGDFLTPADVAPAKEEA